jgi:hypothetical protein
MHGYDSACPSARCLCPLPGSHLDVSEYTTTWHVHPHCSAPPASQKSSCSWKNRVKLIIVAYIRRPPKTDMAAAPPAICAECHRRVGRAVGDVSAIHIDPNSLMLLRLVPLAAYGAEHGGPLAGSDVPIPITTKNPVRNLPKSTTPFPWLSIKSSWFAARPHNQFGIGAITYVATTRSVR